MATRTVKTQKQRTLDIYARPSKGDKAAQSGKENNNVEKRVLSSSVQLPFPTIPSSRAGYLNPRTSKKISDFQFRVYDFTVSIPRGRVTTYGAMAKALDSSARGVGSALKNNPFAPLVPCHRIIAADGFIGGFRSEWGIAGSTKQKGSGEYCNQKIELLRDEGVLFDNKGYLIDKGLIWSG